MPLNERLLMLLPAACVKVCNPPIQVHSDPIVLLLHKQALVRYFVEYLVEI